MTRTSFGRFAAALVGSCALLGVAGAEPLHPDGNEDFCLDMSTGQARLTACSGAYAQEFSLPDGNQLQVGDYCVKSTGRGQPLITVKCSARNDMVWTLDDQGRLQNAANICADIKGGKVREGARVIGNRCGATATQFWSIGGDTAIAEPDPVDDHLTTSALAPQHAPGLCLDVGNRGRATANICNDVAYQTFTFAYDADTTIEAGGSCLTAPGVGQQVVLSRCNNSNNQSWLFSQDGTIQSPSGYCIDVARSVQIPGAPVTLSNCTGQANQRWDALN